MLFPIPLDAEQYKKRSIDRLVGQNGFSYLDQELTEKILHDELSELSKASAADEDFLKLRTIYEYYTGKQFKRKFLSTEEKEQQSLERIYENKTKAELLAALAALGAWDHQQIQVKGKSYKRRNSAIAIIKQLGDYRCQICSASITKKDGGKYIEAAYITAKHKKGKETIDNILLLCPNHDKEFDLGKLDIHIQHADRIDFTLNGARYALDLWISPGNFKNKTYKWNYTRL